VSQPTAPVLLGGTSATTEDPSAIAQWPCPGAPLRLKSMESSPVHKVYTHMHMRTPYACTHLQAHFSEKQTKICHACNPARAWAHRTERILRLHTTLCACWAFHAPRLHTTLCLLGFPHTTLAHHACTPNCVCWASPAEYRRAYRCTTNEHAGTLAALQQAAQGWHSHAHARVHPPAAA